MQFLNEFDQLGVTGETLAETVLIRDEYLLLLEVFVDLGHDDVFHHFGADTCQRDRSVVLGFVLRPFYNIYVDGLDKNRSPRRMQ